jgi:hypothetical protein
VDAEWQKIVEKYSNDILIKGRETEFSEEEFQIVQDHTSSKNTRDHYKKIN